MFVNASLAMFFKCFLRFQHFEPHVSYTCVSYKKTCITSVRTWAKHYTGKTTDRFRYRCNNYKMEAGKAERGDMKNVKHKFLHSHFLQDDQRLSGRC